MTSLKNFLKKINNTKFLLTISLIIIVLANPSNLLADVCDDAKGILKQAENQSGDAQKKLYLKAINVCPTLKEAHYNLGVYYIDEKNFEDAIKSLKKSLEIKKTTAGLVALGRAYAENGDCEKAEETYREAIVKDALNIQARQGIALCRWKNDEVSVAIDVLKEALKIDESNAITLFNLGELYESKSEMMDAKSFYRKTIEQDSMHYKAYTRLAYLLYLDGNIHDAKINLESSLQIENNQSFANYLLFKIYEAEGDSEKSLLYLRRAVDGDPENKEFVLLLASNLIKNKQESYAKNLLMEKAEILKNDYKYYSILALAKMELGEYQEAEEDYKKAIRINPMSSGLYNNLGVLYKRMLRIDEARKSFEKSLAIDADNLEAKKNLKNLK